ncbi:MAG: hypothetical protein MHM6MM_006023 [Cercozoa sp. M6MM]
MSLRLPFSFENCRYLSFDLAIRKGVSSELIVRCLEMLPKVPRRAVFAALTVAFLTPRPVEVDLGNVLLDPMIWRYFKTEMRVGVSPVGQVFRDFVATMGGTDVCTRQSHLNLDFDLLNRALVARFHVNVLQHSLYPSHFGTGTVWQLFSVFGVPRGGVSLDVTSLEQDIELDHGLGRVLPLVHVFPHRVFLRYACVWQSLARRASHSMRATAMVQVVQVAQVTSSTCTDTTHLMASSIITDFVSDGLPVIEDLQRRGDIKRKGRELLAMTSKLIQAADLMITDFARPEVSPLRSLLVYLCEIAVNLLMSLQFGAREQNSQPHFFRTTLSYLKTNLSRGTVWE